MDPHYWRGVGLGGQHAVPVGQAGRLAPRRDPQPAGRALARPHPRRRRAALAVHPRHRRGAHDPRPRRDPGARDRRRDRAGADARHHVRGVAHRRRRARAPHPAVLRDHRQPRHVQGRLVARDEDRAHPVGAHARRAQAVRAGRLGSRRRSGRAVLPARRLHAGEGPGRRAPREGPGAQGAVLGGGRAVQGAAAARHALDVLRHAAADPGGDDVRVPRRRPERDVRA